jgi:hypothetical protein
MSKEWESKGEGILSARGDVMKRFVALFSSINIEELIHMIMITANKIRVDVFTIKAKTTILQSLRVSNHDLYCCVNKHHNSLTDLSAVTWVAKNGRQSCVSQFKKHSELFVIHSIAFIFPNPYILYPIFYRL